MVKIIFKLVFVIHALVGLQANEELFEIIDSFLSPLMPIGLADTPLVEDGPKLKKLCDLIGNDFIIKQKDKVTSHIKGLMGKIAERALGHWSTDKIAICQLTQRNELDKAAAMAKEFNKHGVEANKLRLSFLTALHELKQKGNKKSLPILACYCKEIADKFIAVYPDKDGAKDFMKSAINLYFHDIYGYVFEKEGIKAADNCPMPQATMNPTKYNSIHVALFNAVLTLQDK